MGLYGPDQNPLFPSAADKSAGVPNTSLITLMGSVLFVNNGTLYVPLKGDAANGLIVAPFTAANNDTDGVSNASSSKIANVAGTTAYQRNLPMAYNGSGWDRARTPTVFKPFAPGSISSETTIWTPAAGKKFRLMGIVVYASTAATFLVKDNTAGTTILAFGANTNGICIPLGNGILSAAANNVLTITPGGAATVQGTAFGTEE